MTPAGRRSAPGLKRRRAALAISGLLLVAAADYSWNAATIGGLVGYDATHHLEYVLTLVHEQRLPHPLEGWSTFHPPLYYLLGTLVWSAVRPLGIPAALLGVREISALFMLAAGLVGFLLVLRLDGSLTVASVAAALVLFVPVSLMAATAVGNEALGVGLGALALLALVRLQADPRDLRMAAVAGLMAGLALATKYTGLFVAAACVVPFARADFDRRMLRALVLCGVAGAIIAGPVYVRNIVLTGSPVPMTRNLEPMKSAEERFIIRERRVWDYLWLNPESLWRPTLFHVRGQEGSLDNRNPAMTNIWGLTYASVWYDAFRHRIPIEFHRDGIYSGRLLTLLGIVPTALFLVGFFIALRELIRRRGRTADAPLVVMTSLGLLAFIAFTIRAPSAVAVKASYLLPLATPAAVFFARGAGLMGARMRVAALVISALAGLAAAAVFTNGLIFPPLAVPK
ncbi:MAG: glycosyltransferase family 39 protein [Deltaproteobacteria bacterium]|nr:glycosyltransferase family 39 protein [Deltaproteobacteria bacterium]MCZ6712690.1 glycosyltransferase family 39 protein [Deltaproteobacteria bacterium]